MNADNIAVDRMIQNFVVDDDDLNCPVMMIDSVENMTLMVHFCIALEMFLPI